MTQSLIAVGLIALAGFLIGGVYATWRTSRVLAMLLGTGALLAGAGGVAWLVS